MRSASMLAKIKAEIDKDPATYSKKSPAEIAILMKRMQSRDPQEYNTIVVDKVELIRQKVAQEKLDAIMADLVKDAVVTNDELLDKQEEILDRRCDALGFGEVRQADVEAALALP